MVESKTRTAFASSIKGQTGEKERYARNQLFFIYLRVYICRCIPYIYEGLRAHFSGGGPFRRRRFGAVDSAPPIRRWTTRHRAVSVPDISAPFPNLFYFSSYEEKTMKQAIS